MRRAHLNVSFNVKNDFVPGDCENCPCASRTVDEDRVRTYYGKPFCSMGYGRTICPLEIYDYPENEPLTGGNGGEKDE